MSEATEPTPPRSQLREEAAHWFALMRGPHAQEHQEDFNRWLARGALHRRAYNSVSETFNLGKALKGETIPRSGDLAQVAVQITDKAKRQKSWLGTVFACGGSALLIAGSLHFWQRHNDPSRLAASGPDNEARYITQIGEIRNFVLIDGSKLTLDTNTLVLASYTPHERGLRLVNGRARFYARQEARPFIVRADTTLIRAGDTPLMCRFPTIGVSQSAPWTALSRFRPTPMPPSMDRRPLKRRCPRPSAWPAGKI
jgi:transmembrane sensor